MSDEIDDEQFGRLLDKFEELRRLKELNEDIDRIKEEQNASEE